MGTNSGRLDGDDHAQTSEAGTDLHELSDDELEEVTGGMNLAPDVDW